jgi:hypothetical protein
MANARKKKNFIQSLETDNGPAISQQYKHDVIFNHFNNHMGTYVPRNLALNFSSLGWQPRHLQHLELPLPEEEIHQVVKNAPKEKAPGPDGFIGLFFSACWDIIRIDLIQEVQHFISLNQEGLHLLNQAYVVLIPKKECPEKISEYRPISLIHSFANLVAKILANRLRPELKNLISNNQTAL